jgi:CubicO group peptidase (beta-lactamase class C family)
MKASCSRRGFVWQSGALVLGLSSVGPSDGKGGRNDPARLNTDTTPEALVGELKAAIPPLIERARVPGLSVALIHGARIVWSEGFGVKRAGKPEPVTAETVFEAASLSKPAFAYVFLRFCEDRKIGLDDPLMGFLPKPFVRDEPRLAKITPRRVLSHTSGLPHTRPPGTPIRLRFDPGERFAYSATGFEYLQTVLEHLAGETLGPFMKRRLLEPFGMRDSNFGWLPRYEKQAAQGHWEDGRPGLSGNGRYLAGTDEERARLRQEYPEARYPSAAAGLYTTAADYARFMIEIIQPSRMDSSHLSERMSREMLRPQVHVASGIDWGLGWGLERTKAGGAFWHWGDWGCYRNFAIAYPQQKLGVVVLTNSFNGPEAYRKIVPQALGGSHPALAWVRSYRP